MTFNSHISTPASPPPLLTAKVCGFDYHLSTYNLSRWAASVLLDADVLINCMKLSIHNRKTRILVSVIVFFAVLFLIVPHLMDVEPPLYVEILIKPIEAVGYVVKFIRHLNGGVEEKVSREGSPLDLLFGLIVVFFLALLYPIITYLLLLLVSKVLRTRNKHENNLNLT